MKNDLEEHQRRDAAAVVAAAVQRLDERGLLDWEDPEEQTGATLSVEGLTALHDLVTLFTVNTTGPSLPEHARMAHDAGAIFQQALNLMMFQDAEPKAVIDAKRQLVGALKRAARNYSY